MMKRILPALAPLLVAATAALALTQGSVPTKIPTTWGTNAPGANNTCPPPIPSQIGVTTGRASYTDGFPPATFQSPGAGGVPPFGADFNGALCHYSQWLRWMQAGGPLLYDSAFQTSIGGYPSGATIVSAVDQGTYWTSQTDNNTTNPDANPPGAGWQGGGYLPTGAMVPFGGATAPPGYLLCNGAAVSRATYAALFAVIGTTYGAGNGTTTFNVPDLMARTVYGQDAMGGAAATNRISVAGGGFNAAVLGNAGGQQNWTLAQAQLPAISATFNGTTQTWALSGTTQTWTSNQNNITLIVGGGGAAFTTGNITTTGSITVTVTPNGNTTVTPAGSITWPGGSTNIGSGSSHPTLPPGIIAAYIIKT